MMKVGVTGGIGSGKSTVCRLFAQKGIAVYDSDAAAKRLMQEDGALRRQLAGRFGEGTFRDGQLDRAYLAGIVFADPQALADLNALVHPVVMRDFDAWAARQEGSYVILESALLFDAGFDACVDRTVAGIHNVSVSTVIEQLKQQLGGLESGKMEYRGEMRDILIKVPDITLHDLGGLVIRNGEKEFRLQEIATITCSQAPKEIFRRGQNRISKVTANLDVGYSLDKVADEIRFAVKDIDLPANYLITVTGEEEKRQESMNSLMFALALSVILVYMVLASQFESLLHPFTILLTIPLAVVGAILLFFLTGTTINMMGVIGIVMLVGIAVNNSIILVDRINQLKQSGMELTDAIVESGQQRIRPILMTTLTTILALLPMTFGFGEGASLRSPMAIAVIGGLVTSTVMSLMVIPCVYYVFEKMKRGK